MTSLAKEPSEHPRFAAVEPTAFVARMESYWTDTLGNASSPKLRMLWDTLARVFNVAIHSPETGWKVVPASTGVGKSVGLCVYVSMLPPDVGVLIVTKFVAEAKELADRINALTGSPIALDYHNGHRDRRSYIPSRKDPELPESYVTPEHLCKWPVLITTHRGYELALDQVSRQRRSGYEYLHHLCTLDFDAPGDARRVSQRRLVVVDEAIDMVQEATINAGNLGVLQTVLEQHRDLREKYPKQIAVIDEMTRVMREIARTLLRPEDRPAHAPASGVAMIARHAIIRDSSSCDFTELRADLRAIRFDRVIYRRSSLKSNDRLVDAYDEVLRDLQAVLSQWTWFLHRWNGGPSLTTAKLLMPEGVTSGVILDATARQDVIYKLLPNVRVIDKLPPNPRRYDNVTWHVSTDHKTGADALTRNAKEDIPRIIKSLEDMLEADRKVLVVCHPDVEPYFSSYITDPDNEKVTGLTKFAAFDVVYWGDVNGRNDWRDYDAIFTYGLPHRDPSWGKNTFQATQGPQSNDWLNAPNGARPWNGFEDISLALLDGKIVANLIQAINRVRCRRVVDGDGHCLPVDVFSILGSSEEQQDGTDSPAMQIAKKVRLEMPGIKSEPWKLADVSKLLPPGRKPNWHRGFIQWCDHRAPGKYLGLKVRDGLGIPPNTWKAMMRLLKKYPDHKLTKQVVGLGMTYVVEGAGDNARAYLVKATEKGGTK
jgi:hypothetical protein